MKKNIFDITAEVLKTRDKYIAEDGELLKATVYSDVMTMDSKLIELLLSNDDIKNTFFTDINKTLVFDKQKFAWLIDSKEFLPDSYTAYSNKIGLTSNEKFISVTNDVALDFPYKDCVLEGGQDKEDQTRDEMFYNEIIAQDEISSMFSPKVFTEAKRYTAEGVENLFDNLDTIEIKEEINIDYRNDDNLIIKGNNLIVLSSILKQFKESVKCIYIDPPYFFDAKKAEDTFLYNSNFKLSTWLTFMKNRLELAKEFLTPDGFIFVQISDDGYAYLKVLMDEIFKTENYVNTIIIKSKASSGASGGGEDKKLKKNVEYLLLYGNRNSQLKTQYIKTPLNDYIQERKDEGKSFAYTNVMLEMGNEKFIERIIDGFGNPIDLYEMQNYKSISVKQLANKEMCSEEDIYIKYIDRIYTTENAQTSIRDRVRSSVNENQDFVIARYVPVSGKNKGKLTDVGFIGKTKRLVSYLKETVIVGDGEIFKTEKAGTLWTDISWSSVKFEGDINFGAGKKPEKLIERIIESSTDVGDLVMDYHLGSGTTCAVAHKMGRRYVGIEQMNYITDTAVPRLMDVMKGEQSGISKDVDWQGGGSFVYCELKENGQELIDKILSATEKNISDIKNLVYHDDRLIPYLLTSELEEVDEKFESLPIENKKEALIKLVDKNKLYVDFSDIDDETYCVDKLEKKFTKSFYEEGSNER